MYLSQVGGKDARKGDPGKQSIKCLDVITVVMLIVHEAELVAEEELADYVEGVPGVT